MISSRTSSLVVVAVSVCILEKCTSDKC
jgi:hypothetical protein